MSISTEAELKGITEISEIVQSNPVPKNSVVAIETFISTKSTIADTQADGWTLTGNKGGFVCQHEHTIMITDGAPVILTEMNEIWN